MSRAKTMPHSSVLVGPRLLLFATAMLTMTLLIGRLGGRSSKGLTNDGSLLLPGLQSLLHDGVTAQKSNLTFLLLVFIVPLLALALDSILERVLEEGGELVPDQLT